MREFQLAVRQFLFEELSKKYDCKIGSDFQDISYVDFTEAIRINHEDLYKSAGPVHVCVYTDIAQLNDAISIYVYSPSLQGSVGQSRCFDNCLVDLPAPNFGDLLEIVDGFVQKAIRNAGRNVQRPYIND